MNNNLQKYTEYKDSGVEWLGEIPSHWGTKRIKFLAEIQKGKLPRKIVSINESNLPPYTSMEYLRGGEENQWVLDSNPKIIDQNEILLLWDGSNAGEFIKSRKGVISSTVAQISFYNIDTNFAWYYSKFLEIELRSKTIGMGIPHVNGNELKDSIVSIPPRPEQTAIANFLDLKTAQIDNAIAIKQKQIELLKERRQILIHNAVTRGLNPNAKMKDSGLEWIGEIPEGWEVKKLKYILKERNERSDTGEEPLFMMSQVHGLVVRADYHKKAEVAQTSEGNKIVYTNDLVFNKLKAHLGVFFKSTIDFNGLVSPDYAVYYSNEFIPDLKYLELLFRCPEYLKEFICRITGIVEGLMRLYTQDLFDIAVPVPPLNEQIVILKYIDSIDSKIATAITLKEQEIEKLKEYKGTLINGAVTGKIKVV